MKVYSTVADLRTKLLEIYKVKISIYLFTSAIPCKQNTGKRKALLQNNIETNMLDNDLLDSKLFLSQSFLNNKVVF